MSPVWLQGSWKWLNFCNRRHVRQPIGFSNFVRNRLCIEWVGMCWNSIHRRFTGRPKFIFRYILINFGVGRRKLHTKCVATYEGVSESLRTGRLERELQIVQLPATMCSYIAISWVSLVSFAAITLCVSSQRVFIVVHFVIDSVRKLLGTPSYEFVPALA
jgi:hypothetical protein